VRVRTPPPKSGGGAGTGLARRGSEIASASSAGLPDESIRRADSTWPDRAMVKATEAVPVLAAPDGPFVAVQMGHQLALPGRRRDGAPEPAEGAAAVFDRAAIELGGAVVWRCFGLSGSIGFLRSAACALGGGGSLWAFGVGDGGGGGARVASALSFFGTSGTFISCGWAAGCPA
jgi:hypothetical protein